MRQHGQDPVKFEDIKVWQRAYIMTLGAIIFFRVQDEIYDMVKPVNPLRITLQDLITR